MPSAGLRTRIRTFLVPATILAAGLTFSSSAWAQNGSNLLIFSNGMDAMYAGIGAGGSTVPGVDGLGLHISGEDIRGNTMTTLGDFGYREVGWRESVCVMGPASTGLAIDFPLIMTVEFDGVGAFSPNTVFSFPQCGTAGSFPLGNSAGFVPYGGPTAGSFITLGIPSGANFPGGPTIALFPNEGLVGGPTSATVTLIGAVTTSLPISSTGFCWTVQFGWSPSAMASLDDVDSWYSWRANGRGGSHGLQYWAMSNDELGIWQSQTIASTQGATGLNLFMANLNYDYYSVAVNPTVRDALAPAGAGGDNSFYGIGPGVPNSGDSTNGGFDVGQHQGISLGGSGGVPNPNTSLGNQDPLGSPMAGLVPTLGFFSWNNSPGSSAGTLRLTWISMYNELSLGLDPALNTDEVMFFGTTRTPVSRSQIPGPFPTPTSEEFFQVYVHSTADQSGFSPWTSSGGLPSSGGFGVSPNVGASIHLRTTGLSSICVGLPIGLQYGTSALGGTTGPLLWGQNTSDAPSNSGVLSLID
ncbi:MAG: hypothetical protein ACI9EF_001950 [Pseudohongiellaceae bacterium]|jgi:hypothetical protein